MADSDILKVSDLVSVKDIIILDKNFKNINSLTEYLVDLFYPEMEKVISKNLLLEKINTSPSFHTVLENGLFIPHMKLDNLDDFKAKLVILKKPVKDTETGFDIKLVFIFFTPLEKEFFGKHLNLLSNVAYIFKDISRYLSCDNPEQVYEYIKSVK